ncbi:Uncharacterised protein [Pragia fontium]|uniref:Uncharacterized protein n=1 Tax=Pragia fontium DSM 5563 = ATCC 49100 TaxID=1122977 RepID=A0AAJ4W884_9GAMM|nr:hypothetical protein [Pragia fontium]SFC05375.1 hypothetical protein SAMN02745723_101265 [Pragia fontium DSM 5563 = ATCC 49100]SUB81540.1 Uncharacterised protein [Pragia fontium]
MNGYFCLYRQKCPLGDVFWGYSVVVKETMDEADEYERDIYFTRQRIAKIGLPRPLD